MASEISTGTVGLRERLSDRDLVALVGYQDQEAFACLYDRFARRAYGLALRVLDDRALAEDAVQEAFLNVWRQAGDYQVQRASPATWILVLVHRRAVDLVRREQRYRNGVGAARQVAEPDHALEPVADRAEGRRVLSSLAFLTPVQRQAIELTYLEGYTQGEAARRLGIPLGTIKSRVHFGMRALAALLVSPGQRQRRSAAQTSTADRTRGAA